MFKKLAIVSDCVHLTDNNGNVVTENHIFRRQMQMLASHFEETIICCPFGKFSENKVTSIYTNPTIQFIRLPQVGGNTFLDKLKLIKTIPVWIRAFKKINAWSDVVYQRFPNNLNIPGFVYFYLTKTKVFATYTGTWKNYSNEPFTYRLQKWFLRKYFRGPVWAYTTEENNDGKIIKSFSPSYTLAEWTAETEQLDKRYCKLKQNKMCEPVFITVGALIIYKNQQYILDAFKILSDEKFSFKLFVVGDGPLKEQYENFILKHQLQDKIFLTGSKTHKELQALYRQADFIIQAPLIEGFGKVPMEGFFHGVIPILNDTDVSKEMTGSKERGFVFTATDPNNLVKVIDEACKNKEALAEKLCKGRDYARAQTLENWTQIFIDKLNEYYQ